MPVPQPAVENARKEDVRERFLQTLEMCGIKEEEMDFVVNRDLGHVTAFRISGFIRQAMARL